MLAVRKDLEPELVSLHKSRIRAQIIQFKQESSYFKESKFLVKRYNALNV